MVGTLNYTKIGIDHEESDTIVQAVILSYANRQTCRQTDKQF